MSFQFRFLFLAAIVAQGNSSIALFAQTQCEQEWAQNDGLPGLSDSVEATAIWDPDGPGPQPELLVVGGRFKLLRPAGGEIFTARSFPRVCTRGYIPAP